MFCKTKFRKLPILIISLLVISQLVSYAQEFPLEKQKRDFQIWTFTNLLHKFEGGSFFFARLNTQSSVKFNSLLNYKEYRLGYSQFIQKKLYAGAFIQTDNNNTFTYRLFLNHRNKISEVYFSKRLSFEASNHSNVQQNELKQGRLLLGLSYPIKIGAKKKFEPMIAYEVFKQFDKSFPSENQRKIDQTRLRIDLNYTLSSRVKLALLFFKETSYYFALAQFQLDTNGQLIEIKPERRLNLVKPVYLFSTFITLNKKRE